MSHAPVLVEKVIEAVAPVDGGVLVDATYGGGGYSRAALAVANVTVLAVDRDPEAMERAWAHAGKDPRLVPAAVLWYDWLIFDQDGHRNGR